MYSEMILEHGVKVLQAKNSYKVHKTDPMCNRVTKAEKSTSGSIEIIR